jgi:hypothetical protein
MRQPVRPVLVTLIAIVQLIVGALLLACNAFGLVVTFAGESSATVTIRQGGEAITRVYDTREEMEKQAPGHTSVLHGSAAAELAFNFAMIVGAIGVLRLRAWGWWLSLAWALLRILYQVVTAYYLWTVAMPAANRVVQTVPRDEAGLCGSMANGKTFYHVGWALFATCFALYPLLILIFLILPPVSRAFRRSDAAGEEDRAEEDLRRARRRREEMRSEDDRRRRDRDDY